MSAAFRPADLPGFTVVILPGPALAAGGLWLIAAAVIRRASVGSVAARSRGAPA